MNISGLSPHAWLQAHWLVARDSLGRLLRAGPGSLLTVLMMGCTLALPASLYVLGNTAAQASSDWQQSFSVSLYLSDRISDKQGRALLDILLAEPLIERGEYLSKDQALEEFRQYSGLADALDLMDNNPLPAVLILWPRAGTTRAQLEDWLAQQSPRPEIARAQADTLWLERLHALLGFGRQLIQIMGIMLALTVSLVVANAIRLEIAGRRQEILVMKLIGAPDGFIQRPFLYAGTLYGLLSGLVACFSVVLILYYVEPHLQTLALSYGSTLELQGLQLNEAFNLTALAGLMGWLGAWQSVWRHLREIEPD